MVLPPWKTVWQLLVKLNMHLTYNPAIVFMDIYSTHNEKQVHTHTHTQTCKWMFTVVLFVIIRCWKWPKHPSKVNSWTVLHPYHSAIEWKELLIHSRTWINLQELCWIKKSNLKRLHAVWLHLHNILEMTKL